MLNWLTEYSTNLLYLDCRIDLSQIRFHFEFFNLKLELNIPIPFGSLLKENKFKSLSYKEYTFHKDCFGPKQRTLEIQTFYDNLMPIGFTFQKHSAPVDHDPIEIEFCFGLFSIVFNYHHNWHVKHCGDIDRFPTEFEARKIVEFDRLIRDAIFGTQHIDLFPEDENEKKRLSLYWDTLHTFEQNLFGIDYQK